MKLWSLQPHQLMIIIRGLYASGEEFTTDSLQNRWSKNVTAITGQFSYYSSRVNDKLLNELEREGSLKHKVGSKKMVDGSKTIYIYWYE